MEFRHSGSTCPTPKKFRVQKSSRKVLASIIWDQDEIPLINYLPKGQTINPEYYSIEGHFEGKIPLSRKYTKWVLFLHDNAPAHRLLATQKKLAYLDFQPLDHPPYPPDLTPSDYHLIPGLKKQLKCRHFWSDAEVIAAAETCLDGQISEFFLCGLQKLEQRIKKYIELCGEYVE